MLHVDGVPDELWEVLRGHLWHATSSTNARSILDSKKIKHDIPEAFYCDAFVRSFGGVSLFDFRVPPNALQLDPSSWRGWLGREKRAPVAVWFRIDVNACAQDSIIEPAALFGMWQCYGGNLKILPAVEAAHVGPVPIDAIASVLLIDAFDSRRFLQLEHVALMHCVLPKFSKGNLNARRYR